MLLDHRDLADMTSTLTPLRLLVVDDDEVDREQTLRLLSRCGLDAHLTEAPDATSALALCKQDGFDCVLLDRRLPDMDGLELAAELMNESTAVVMLTGHGGDAVVEKAMARGVKAVLRKDALSPDGLQHAIVNAVVDARLESSAA